MTIGKLQPGKPNRNVDSSSLLDSVEYMMDCYFDSTGAINKRPGCQEFVDCDKQSRVDGVFTSTQLQRVFAACDGEIYSIEPTTQTITKLIGSDLLNSNSPVIWAEAKSGSDYVLFMVNGGNLLYTIDGINVVKSISTGSGSLPTSISHVVYFDTYLLVTSAGSSRISFSNPNLPFKFDAGDTFDCESLADNLLGLYPLSGKLYALGEQGVEIFYNSGQSGSPFRRYGTFALDTGVYSASTVTLKDDKLIFIDTRRRVIELNSSGYTELSTSYAKEIEGLSSVEESLAFNLNIVGKEFYLVTFLRIKRTFVYDHDLKTWYEWGYWDASIASYLNYIAACSCHVPWINRTLIGSFFNGKIYEMANQSDFTKNTDDGVEIRGRILTADYSFGNISTMKNSLGITFRLKRGVGKDDSPYETPYFKLRKADDGRNIEQNNFISLSLGASGDTRSEVTAMKGAGGQYKTRRYEIIFSDPAPFVLSAMEEKFKEIKENV